jgi:hypothetical protein
MALLGVSQARATTITFSGGTFGTYTSGPNTYQTYTESGMVILSAPPTTSVSLDNGLVNDGGNFYQFYLADQHDFALEQVVLSGNATGGSAGGLSGQLANFTVGPGVTLTGNSAQETIDFNASWADLSAVLWCSSTCTFLAPSETMLSLTFDEIQSATPLPAALPLFATGLGALGLFGWRKKRKNAATLAAG